MGTNYYIIYNECKCCNRHDKLHLGKASGGWKFSFQTIEDLDLMKIDPVNIIAGISQEINISSWKEMKAFLYKYVVEHQTARIVDEYDEPCSYDEFVEMVNNKFTDKNKSHYVYVKNEAKSGFDANNDLIDDEGHSFSRIYFS